MSSDRSKVVVVSSMVSMKVPNLISIVIMFDIHPVTPKPYSPGQDDQHPSFAIPWTLSRIFYGGYKISGLWSFSVSSGPT